MINNLLEKVSRKTCEIGEKAFVCKVYANHEGKLIIYVCDKEEENVYCAYECDNTKEDVSKVLDAMKPVFEAEGLIRDCAAVSIGYLEEVDKPAKFGYGFVFQNDNWLFMGNLYHFVNRKINSIRQKIIIMNERDALKNALKVWSTLQPTGLKGCLDGEDADRYDMGTIDYSLSFLKEWDFLLLATEEEIRLLYKKYYEATISFYYYEMTQNR